MIAGSRLAARSGARWTKRLTRHRVCPITALAPSIHCAPAIAIGAFLTKSVDLLNPVGAGASVLIVRYPPSYANGPWGTGPGPFAALRTCGRVLVAW